MQNCGGSTGEVWIKLRLCFRFSLRRKGVSPPVSAKRIVSSSDSLQTVHFARPARFSLPPSRRCRLFRSRRHRLGGNRRYQHPTCAVRLEIVPTLQTLPERLPVQETLQAHCPVLKRTVPLDRTSSCQTSQLDLLPERPVFCAQRPSGPETRSR